MLQFKQYEHVQDQHIMQLHVYIIIITETIVTLFNIIECSPRNQAVYGL